MKAIFLNNRMITCSELSENTISPNFFIYLISKNTFLHLHHTYVHTENKEQEMLLNNLGADSTIFDAVVKEANDRLNEKKPVPRHRKTGPKKASKGKAAEAADLESSKRKPGVQAGTKRSDLNKDGTPRKKPGPKKGFKRSDTRQDGTPRKKPGPKPGSHHKKN